MRDFPVFTTEYGVSSLILREIPYRSEAYIRILDVQENMLEAHLKECRAFCRMAGADRIYATGEGLDRYPEFTTLVEMRGAAEPDAQLCACLFPVTEQTAARWRELYNRAMAAVDTAKTLEKKEERSLWESSGAYFVHDGGKLLGIGWIREGQLLAVASVEPGAGKRIMHTLMSAMEEEEMVLEVASTNGAAIRLYEALGFIKTRELVTWYDVTAEPGNKGQ